MASSIFIFLFVLAEIELQGIKYESKILSNLFWTDTVVVCEVWKSVFDSSVCFLKTVCEVLKSLKKSFIEIIQTYIIMFQKNKF